MSLAASMGAVFATSVLVGHWLKEKDVKEVRSKSDQREIHTHVPLSLSSHLLPVCVQLQLMQVGAVTSSACLVVHVTQTKTSASVFHPFMESTAPTPLVRTDQHNQCTGFYICT